MKFNRHLLLLAAITTISTGIPAFAAETGSHNSDLPPAASPVVPPTVPPTTPPPTDDHRGGRPPRIEIPRIEVPAGVRDQLPQALQDQIAHYRELSQAFIDQQRELTTSLRTATEDERNRIREQLRGNRERFLADTQTLRTEIRDQLREIRHTMREQQGGTNPGRGRGERPRG
jgi:gas vesicle protein